MSYRLSLCALCMLAAACGSDDKALRSPGPGGTTVTVGAAGAPPVNPLQPPISIGPQVAQNGAGIGGTEVRAPDPFQVAGSSASGGSLTGAAGSAAISSTPISSPPIITPISGAAGTGF